MKLKIHCLSLLFLIFISPLNGETTDPWIRGSIHLGADVTFWALDDFMSSSTINLETQRDPALFYKLGVVVEDFFGFKGQFNLFLDQLLQPFGFVTPDFSLGQSFSSGGSEVEIIWYKINLLRMAEHALRDTDFDDLGGGGLYPQFRYRYRLFRWTNQVTKTPITDSLIDYYNEEGERSLHALGDSIETGSQWHYFTLGLGGLPVDDGPIGVFLGLEYWSLLAPTLLSLYNRDDIFQPGAQVLMHSENNYLGLRLQSFFGFDGRYPESMDDFLNIGASLALSLGSFSVSNEYIQGPGSLGFNSSGSIHTGLVLEPWDGASGYLLFGLEGTWTLMSTNGVADDPGEVKKDFQYRFSGGNETMSQGTSLDLSVFRMETYGGPFLKFYLSF